VSRLRLRLAVSAVALIALAFAGGANAASSELFFSEYIEGSSQNKAVEIFNGTPTAVDLAAGGYNVFISFNGGTSTRAIGLTGTVAPGDVYVYAQATADPAILAQADQTDTSTSFWNGDDAVLLRKGTVVIDAIGQVGFDPGAEWGSSLTSTADNTLRRKAAIQAGDTNPSDVFDPTVEWDGFATNTFDGLGSHTAGPPPANALVVATCGSNVSVVEGSAASKVVTATDADGTVTGFTAATSPTPTVGSISITSQTPAPADGGTASATISISDAVPAGTYTVEVTAANDDATPQTGTCSFTVTVIGIKTIGEVQGSVTDADLGPFHRSPFAPPSGNAAGATVVVRGVVYQKTFALESDGDEQHGFFIQNTAAQADGDPTTSDGIWVFLGRFRDVLNVTFGQPAYLPQVGDEIVLQGRVTEFFNLTELGSPRFVRQVASALDVDVVVPPVVVNPADDLTVANRQWERLEAMRVQVPGGALVTDGLDVFASTADSEMWLVRGDHEIAQRTGYAQRVFRDAHPLDDEPGLVDNGNGFRILVGALGLKALADDNTLLLPASRTFDTVGNALVGGLNYSFNKYRIETEDTPALSHGIEPALNAPPTAGDRSDDYSVGDYNVENLYDFRDDPNDGCDFADDDGCDGVDPPFDYVPASDEVYQERLGLIAEQIVGDLHAPDILLVQEAEDQDICTVAGGELACGASDDADGKPDTLQELALRIEAQSGIAYDAAYDRDGSDDRGIVAALMYRTDRVELLEATADHPVLGNTPDFTYRSGANDYNADVQNPKSLNAPLPDDVTGSRDGNEVYTRDPQVGWFRVWRNAVGSGAWVDVYAISNHFSSTPDNRVNQRREQAAYLAAIVGALDSEYVVAGGDFNVFPRPDDPLNPPSDQLGPLYEAGLENLWDVLVSEEPQAAYSYVFVGQAQTLDGQFVTPTLLDELSETRVAHVNADYPAEYPGDGARGLSDHDPLASRFELVATLERLEALLAYYCEAGAITGNNTCTQLQHHLEQSRHAGDEQLRAFIDQVEDKSPRFITPAAAAALVGEAERLLQD
jgi:predicted extracellular nuclease